MPNNETETTIVIGRTDGYRYIGIIPPLTNNEIESLVVDGVIRRGQIEQIGVSPKHTVVNLGEAILYPRDNYPEEVASAIENRLKETRKKVTVEPEPIFLYGNQIFK